jgi:hypothetical protein
VKGILILFCVAGLLLAVTPASAQAGPRTGQTQTIQQSSPQSTDNGKTTGSSEVKKEVTPQPSSGSGNAASPTPQPAPENRVNTAPIPPTYNYNSSNQGGQSHPDNGGGGGSGGGYGRGGGGGGGGGGYHGHSGYYENPWRYGGFSSDWNIWAGPGPVFVPDYGYDYGVPVPSAPVVARLDRGVYVQSSVGDAVGSGLAYAVNGHAQADNLVPVTSPDAASLELFVASADEDPIHPGTLSAVSVTYIWLPGYRFITSQVMNVGSSQVEAAAGAVADEAAQLIQTYRR